MTGVAGAAAGAGAAGAADVDGAVVAWGLYLSAYCLS
jgi:hypothetical protein